MLQLVTVALSVAASQAQEQPNGFYLTSPMNISSGYDHGFLTGSGTFSDSVTILAEPTVAWMRSTHRTDFSVDYQLESETFANNPRLNAVNHLSAMRYRYRINARWSAQAGNLFLSTMDANRAVANSLLLLPRGRFLQNSAYVGLGYRVNAATKISFRLDNAFTNTDLPGALRGRLNGVTTAGTVEAERKLTSRQKLTVGYSFLHSHPLQSEISGSPINVQLVNAGYSFEINPGLIVHFAGGMVKGNQSSFIGAAGVEKRIKGMWLAAGYQRYLSFFGGNPALSTAAAGAVGFADGLTPNSVYQVVSMRAWGQVSSRIGLEGGAQRALNGTDPAFGAIRAVVIQTKVSYKLSERIAWFVRLEHYGQTANAFFDTPLSRNRYFTGLEIALSRPRQPENAQGHRRTAPQESDELKALPPEEN
jgi:hypothetical protein